MRNDEFMAGVPGREEEKECECREPGCRPYQFRAGVPGKPGKDGFSPLVEVEEVEGAASGLPVEDESGGVWRLPEGAGDEGDILVADEEGNQWHMPAGAAGPEEILAIDESGGVWHIPTSIERTGHRVTITDKHGEHVFYIWDGSGRGRSSDVFIAEYGITTLGELDKAYNAGKIILVRETVPFGVFKYYRLISAYNHWPGTDGREREYTFAVFSPFLADKDRTLHVCQLGAYGTEGWTKKEIDIAGPEYFVTKAQGLQNAGKFLIVGENGEVALTQAPTGGGGYTTPEEYGAQGDGTHDDAPALKAALESGKPVLLTQDLHLFSAITVEDKDLFLDGMGHTLHLHGDDMESTACIFLRAVLYDGVIDGADVVMHTEMEGTPGNYGGVLNPGFPSTAYRRGYLSYHGFNPTPDKEVYENEELHSWREMRADIRNTVFVGHGTAGKCYLRVSQSCHSTVDNCTFIVPEGEDAICGIDANNSYDLKITGCRADGFCADLVNHGWGYGIKANGDAVLIHGCTVKNCKVGVCVGGGGEYMSTGVVISDLIAQVKDSGRNAKANGGRLYQQMLDIHEGCLRPVVDTAWLEYENASENDVIGTLIHVSCPEATLVNIHCQYHSISGYNPGYVGLGPLARKIHFHKLYAPKCRLYLRGWSRLESGDAYAPNYVRELEIDGGEISSIRGGGGLIALRLSGVKITGVIEAVQSLTAQNCVIRVEDQFQTSVTPVNISGEASFVNCEIYGPLNPNAPRSKPVIAAPENTVRLTACTVRKRLDCKLFKTEQPEPVNTAVYDLFGLILGSQVSPLYVDGDACELGAFNLW